MNNRLGDYASAYDFIVDKKGEPLYTVRGTLKMGLLLWRDEANHGAREVLRRYCQYLALHGYGRGAREILDDLDALNTDQAIAWIQDTHARFVTDDDSLLRYILGALEP